MKDFLYRLQPVQLYVILVLSVVFFIVQLTSYQFSDSITLLVAAYHMLCNIIALSGCIITIKVSFIYFFRLKFFQLMNSGCVKNTENCSRVSK